MKEHEGWNLAEVTLPDKTTFALAFKGDTIRIRKASDDVYWCPVETTFHRGKPEENVEKVIYIKEDL